MAPVADAVLLAPLRYPRKILCAGADYHAHLQEMGVPPPAGPVEPYLFFKPPTTTVVGPDEEIRLPARPDDRLGGRARGRDLPTGIGRRAGRWSRSRGRLAPPQRRVRARPAQQALSGPARAGDASCPMGPGIVPDWLVDDRSRCGCR